MKIDGTAAASWRGRALEAVLFDLDGTLLDTAGDISTALNRALEEHGWMPLSASDVRRMIGRGSPVLIERAAAAQGRTLDDASSSALLESFFRHYGHLEESGGSTARPYPGAAECVRALQRAALRTAVVTNKHERFARGLLERSDLRIDCVVGGDSFERRKPDPGPLLFACERLAVAPSHALMVGDSTNDVQAARGAPMPIICVPYGYNEGQDPRTLACDAFIESLADLPGLLIAARS